MPTISCVFAHLYALYVVRCRRDESLQKSPWPDEELIGKLPGTTDAHSAIIPKNYPHISVLHTLQSYQKTILTSEHFTLCNHAKKNYPHIWVFHILQSYHKYILTSEYFTFWNHTTQISSHLSISHSAIIPQKYPHILVFHILQSYHKNILTSEYFTFSNHTTKISSHLSI